MNTSVFSVRSLAATLLFTAFFSSVNAQSTMPDSDAGSAAALEVKFLATMIDHDYSALRITELALGSGQKRNSSLEDISATVGKSRIDEVIALAQQENDMRREEIVKAQKYLMDWYRISHQPVLTSQAQAQIDALQSTGGAVFDQRFLESMSEHHFVSAVMADVCLAGFDREHPDLKSYCIRMLDSQLSGIDRMRELLCQRFNECHWQPEYGMDALREDLSGE